MAKRKKDDELSSEPVETLDDSKLSKYLIRQFNSGDDKIAWNLSTDHDNPTEVKEFISTGSTLLDYICSNRRNGGAPVGKLTEFVGEEASGKSLICSHLIANCQKRGGIAIYIDTENAANPEFMQAVGVDISKLVYLQPGTVEEVGEAIEKAIVATRLKAPDKLVLIIWDSTAGTPCRAEIEGSYNPADIVGLKARAMSLMMKKLTMVWGKERICMVFTNQLKVGIGIKYGDPMVAPGGKAVPYHASLRVKLQRSVRLKEGIKKGEDSSEDAGGDVYGIHTIAKTIKSRLGPPLRRCEFDITFAFGIDDERSWFDFLHGAGKIEKNGGWCYYSSYPSGRETTRNSQGAPVTKDWGLQFREKEWKETLAADPKFRSLVLDDIENLMIVKYGDKPADLDETIETGLVTGQGL